MKLSEEMSKLIALGTQYGERVEYTQTTLKVDLCYSPVRGTFTELLTRVTIQVNGSQKIFELSPIQPCAGLQKLQPYSVALAKLTEFTDALRASNYTYDGVYK